VGVTAVVHLVWGPLGVEPLRSFLRSYRQHDAGADHELVIVFNGVPRPGAPWPPRLPRGAHAHYADAKAPEREAFLAELSGIPHQLIDLEDAVQDLPAYAIVAARLQHERFCFLNSHSAILAPQWLAKLSAGLDGPRVGLVAATGSWASFSSWVMFTLPLPSAYRGVLPSKQVAKQQFSAIEMEREGADPDLDGGPAPAAKRPLLDRLRELPAIPEQLIRFGRFPTPHLRTNAFMVERELFTSLRIGRIARKMDAYSLESGRNSITRQVQRCGLQTLLAARDGELYEPARWPQSRAFWQGEQEGLLVADNQTRFYSNGSPARRRLLAAFAWGSQADPGGATASVRS
jgi:hypothetical protein